MYGFRLSELGWARYLTRIKAYNYIDVTFSDFATAERGPLNFYSYLCAPQRRRQGQGPPGRGSYLRVTTITDLSTLIHVGHSRFRISGRRSQPDSHSALAIVSALSVKAETSSESLDHVKRM